ncbi:ABC transporter substrate-binding protein [Shimia abyssi]|uniref:NitT/TauT family transport system ATP-binding protein n=1 Tax=Shimia abyssi TaxID=1662395 RepID=A0A2P8FHN3_9RHOB|nr:CmpA/NrtA family ABC transporter substrate-binding protein [Shimia abyssi]PSL21217.1 NitT/TauT family transport system ATP-binding protein [Shimia abyssi]
MKTQSLNIGFMPLVDAAPLIIAHELGFAEEEGLTLTLQPSPSWSTLRDHLVLGQIDAAHMLSPVPIAMALGLGGISTRLDALSVLSVNGNVFGVSNELASRLRASEFKPDFTDALAAGQALAQVSGELRIGVPFPFSMHAELLHYWLVTFGQTAPQALKVRTIPPPLMADAIASGEIDAFCVGEPWGSITVENGGGELLLPGARIWQFCPEKVLAVRSDWVSTNDNLAGRLLRATWKAGRWLGDASKLSTAAEILGWPEYLGIPAEILERSLTGHMIVSQHAPVQRVPRMVAFFDAAATFPWKSQAAFIATQLANRHGLDPIAAARDAATIFRSDLYRRHLAPLGADMPGASVKLEGALAVPTSVASDNGTLILGPDAFFDGRIFDPPVLE